MPAGIGNWAPSAHAKEPGERNALRSSPRIESAAPASKRVKLGCAVQGGTRGQYARAGLTAECPTAPIGAAVRCARDEIRRLGSAGEAKSPLGKAMLYFAHQQSCGRELISTKVYMRHRAATRSRMRPPTGSGLQLHEGPLEPRLRSSPLLSMCPLSARSTQTTSRLSNGLRV